jgi:hypothetical protein
VAEHHFFVQSFVQRPERQVVVVLQESHP